MRSAAKAQSLILRGLMLHRSAVGSPKVRWCAEDVIAAAEQNGITLTEAQAEKWLEKNERWFRETLTEYGNEVLASASKESFEEVCKV